MQPVYKDDPKFRPVDLRELERQFRGTPFAQLVEHHLRTQSQLKRIQGGNGTAEMLPEKLRPMVMGWIDRWNPRGYDASFWRADAADVMKEILIDARSIIIDAGLSNDDETAFNMFQIIVLNFAYSAYDQPKMRKFAGIRFGILDRIRLRFR